LPWRDELIGPAWWTPSRELPESIRPACAGREDVIMRRTTTALALAGSLLAAPAAAFAASPLRAPVGDHPTVAAALRAEQRQNEQEDLTRAVQLTRRLEREQRRDRQERRERRQASTASPVLEAIAQCESGGNPATDTGNGFYGKYQFTLETWNAVGGSGNPAHASEAEQDRRAAMLYAQAGPSPWPVCGR
jgi:hypothetical protein